MPPPPPTRENISPDDMGSPQEFNEMRRKLDAACISGIMQTGSAVFKELSKNGADKLSKLKFIKERLESIFKKALNSWSKAQITSQLNTINSIIKDMEQREAEVKIDPNTICRKTEELKKINKNMREKILWLSGDIKDIREHEKREWFLEHIKETIFPDKQDKFKWCEEQQNKAWLNCPIPIETWWEKNIEKWLAK